MVISGHFDRIRTFRKFDQKFFVNLTKVEIFENLTKMEIFRTFRTKTKIEILENLKNRNFRKFY